MMKFTLLLALLNLLVASVFSLRYQNAQVPPPYLVYLKSDYLPCTGALIHPLWVITSAHCNLPNLKVVLGATNPADHREIHAQVIGYVKMIDHPHFTITSIENDLMLIKLRREIQLNAHVQLVSLPHQDVPESTICTVSTWSYNLCFTSKDPDSMQMVKVSVVPKAECQEAYRAYHIRDSMVCLGIVPGRRQACKEVTAALAVCNGTLHGILALTDGCVLRADVSIYTRIFSYMSWIKDVIQKN